MAHFRGKVRTVTSELSLVNVAAGSATGEYSWSKWEIS